ncbi:MAG: hypothetical protein M3Y51_03055 [Actinomycetota bacterium]|nr:hypothetical protein [Actinomycetota bacterium]
MILTTIAAVAALGAACAPGPTGDGPANDDTTTVLRPTPGAVRPTPTTAAPGGAPSTTAAPPITVAPPTGPVSFRATSTRSQIGGCDVFPANHYLNATNIDRLPVHPNSDRWLSGQRSRGSAISTPSSTVWQGSSSGIPINVVDSRVTGMQSVLYTINVSPHEYRGRVPLPAAPRVEGHPGAAWDRHVLVVDSADCSAYELIQYEHTLRGLGPRTANSGAKYSLSSTDRVKFTTNSPNTPMIGQAFRVDEVNAGAVHHVSAFCSNTIASSHVWPASSSDGKQADTSEMPMGAWARLKANVDLSRFSGQARAMAQALRTHGTVLTDTCSQNMHLTGENSTGWNAADLRQLQSLTANDFEIVDTTSLKVSDDSWAIR